MKFKNKVIQSLGTSGVCALLAMSSVGAVSMDKEQTSKKFAELSDQFIKESLVNSPIAASEAGYHKHTDTSGRVIELDGMLDDMSLRAMHDRLEFFKKWRRRFAKETPLASLEPQDAADWRLIDDRIGLEILDTEKIQSYAHNPTIVVESIGQALFQPLTEDYAPKEVRLGHIVSRIGQVKRLLEQTKQYLHDCDPIYISTAIEENDGNIELIEKTVSAEIPAGTPLREKYDRVVPPTVQALKDFSKWLKDDLAKQPNNRSWRLGKSLYDQKFKLVMQVDISSAELLKDAEKNVKSVRAEMLQIAEPLHKQMFADHGDHADVQGVDRENLIIGEVLRKISDDRPRRDDLLQTVEKDLDGIKQFIRDHKIVTLGPRENLKVVATPLSQRGVLSVAAFHSAPPLNPTADAQYWVTPIDPKMSDAAVESKLREYNNLTLKWLTIHEALPGHYVQFEHANNIQPERRRLLRTLYSNGAYVEGWAEYVAQVMMDEGFMNNDPRFRLIMRKIRLRVLCNAILDIKMHTKKMTDQQALDLMTKTAFQTQAEAEGKLKRSKLTSAQLPTYYAGIREWFAFRKAYQAKLGDQFDLCKFHDAALDEGPLPVPSVQKLMMPTR